MPLTNIQILRSAVPYKRPDVSFLLDGQLALNYKAEEPGLFAKLQNGNLVKIGPTSITTNGDFPNQNPDPTGVAGNTIAEKWFDDRAVFHTGIEKIWDGGNWRTVTGFTLDDATGDMEMLRTLGVDTLNANAVNIAGPLDVAGDITPNGTSCVYSLGGPGQRFNGLYGCLLDIQFDAQIGNNLQVIGQVDIGGDTNVTGDLFVSGQQASFGQSCVGGNFTIETPAFLNCDTAVLGDVSIAGDIVTVGDIDIGGSARLGNGCGVSTFVVDADTTFNCPVTFSGSTFFFGTGCTTSSIVWNGAMEQRCDLVPDLASSVNLASAAIPYLSVYSDNFEGGFFTGDVLTLTAKGTSAATVDGDGPTTLTTKDWVLTTINDAVDAADEWERVNGNEIRTINANEKVVPNGTADIGATANRWANGYFNNVFTNDLHLRNERGDWTMIEEEDVLTLRNNKTGQRFAISMTPYVG